MSDDGRCERELHRARASSACTRARPGVFVALARRFALEIEVARADATSG